MRWYAVHTKPNCEQRAFYHLRAQGYEVFYPHIKEEISRSYGKKEVVKRPYLSRYLFVGLNDGQSLYPINSTIGVACVVYFGNEPVEIPQAQMLLLKSRTDLLGEVYSEFHKRPDYEATPGDRVLIGDEGGALWGFWARIKEVCGPSELVVELEEKIFGQALELTISPAQVGELQRQRPVPAPNLDPIAGDGGSLSCDGQINEG